MPWQSVNTSRNFVQNSMSSRVNGLLLDRVFKTVSFRNGQCSKSLLIFSLLSLSVWMFVFVVPMQKRNSISVKIEFGGASETVQTSAPAIPMAPSGDGAAHEGAELRDFKLSEERLSRYSLFHPRTNGAPEESNAWYQNNVEPSITCLHEDRIGNHGEGGKWMCNIDALRDKKDCLIYSIGSNNDFSWEEGVKARAPNCVIHVFDHTVANASNKPHNVFFHRWGLSEVDSNRNPNLKSLSEISQALGHKDKRVDVFKIDCEGCEWRTYKTWFISGLLIEEILVETHYGSESPKPNSYAKQFFTHLHESGYRIFHKEPNVHYSGGKTLCVEFGLKRID